MARERDDLEQVDVVVVRPMQVGPRHARNGRRYVAEAGEELRLPVNVARPLVRIGKLAAVGSPEAAEVLARVENEATRERT